MTPITLVSRRRRSPWTWRGSRRARGLSAPGSDRSSCPR